LLLTLALATFHLAVVGVVMGFAAASTTTAGSSTAAVADTAAVLDSKTVASESAFIRPDFFDRSKRDKESENKKERAKSKYSKKVQRPLLEKKKQKWQLRYGAPYIRH
jgi:hypothetical protein